MLANNDRYTSFLKLPLLMMVAALLCSCASANYYKDDRPPRQDRDISAIPDAVPKIEPITQAGNKTPYRVLGQTYHLLSDNRGYKARGIASWYDTKLHGKKTSNGETYNMFAMSAAHKTLRMPAYVRVTNIDNGRQVVVRVNDRGPFLHDRLIDLSYAAAKKLGYADSGFARVDIEYIDPLAQQAQSQQQPQSQTQAQPVPPLPQLKERPMASGAYLQLAAFSTAKPALQMQARVRKLSAHSVLMMINEGGKGLLYKVLVGPLDGPAEQQRLKQLLKKQEKLSPFLVHF